MRGIDRYKRTLGEIVLPDRNLGHELLRAGLAWWYQQFAKNEHVLAGLAGGPGGAAGIVERARCGAAVGMAEGAPLNRQVVRGQGH